MSGASQVFKYAEYLGFDLNKYPELYGLMEQGLRAPLPAGWDIVTEGNSHYFLNNVSGVRQKDHPADDTFRQAARRQIADLGLRSPSPPRTASSPLYSDAPSQPRQRSTPSNTPLNNVSSSGETIKAARYVCIGFLIAVLLHASVAMVVFKMYSADGIPELYKALGFLERKAPEVAPPPPAPAAPVVTPATTATEEGEGEDSGSWW
jgi:hypothetical protein